MDWIDFDAERNINRIFEKYLNIMYKGKEQKYYIKPKDILNIRNEVKDYLKL